MGTYWYYALVKKYVESFGYELISEEYKNNHTKLILKDKDGYYYTITLMNLLAGYKPSFVEKHNQYTIQNIKLWCKLNNKPFKLISEIYERSSKKLKWQCLKENCKETFEKEWASISQNHGCPYCVNQKVNISNCLATKNPKLAKQWHLTKNSDLTPYNVVCGSDKKIWWKCLNNSNHEWKASINTRIRGDGCPYCSGRRVSDENNLLAINPELCKEWDYDKNKKKPEEYTANSNTIVWWVCSKNNKHKWKSTIANRNYNNQGCPYCASNPKPSEDYNLLVINPILCEEWNYDKNKKEPNEYTPVSGRKVWWICKECGYEWETAISHRVNGTGCPECFEFKGEKKISELLKNNKIDFKPQYIFNNLLSNKGKSLRFDFGILNSKKKLIFLIEYDGKQHYEWVSWLMTKEGFKRLQYHDQLKNNYCKDNNIPLLRIPYWEFNNIKNILNEWLNNINKIL